MTFFYRNYVHTIFTISILSKIHIFVLSKNMWGFHKNSLPKSLPLKLRFWYNKIANIRKDYLNKVSTKLVKENQLIGIEDLQVKNMLKNHQLAQASSDVSWSEFFRMLEYNAVPHGCRVVRVPKFYPNSQTCCKCGYQNKDTKNLAIRAWDCPVCGHHQDREVNAATNIRA